ncbi:hypothetical protein YC2023_061239 [Brassica napus]
MDKKHDGNAIVVSGNVQLGPSAIKFLHQLIFRKLRRNRSEFYGSGLDGPCQCPSLESSSINASLTSFNLWSVGADLTLLGRMVLVELVSKELFRNITFINEQKTIIPLPYLLLHHRFLSLSPSHRRLSLSPSSHRRLSLSLEFWHLSHRLVPASISHRRSLSHRRLSATKSIQNLQDEKTQDEEEQQVEVDAEFGDGDKERETSKINETREEEEEQMEADTEVEEPVQVERQKRGRGNKINNSLSNDPYTTGPTECNHI